MINWSKLQPYKTTKQKSFEQLCYEIAVKLYPEGKFTPIDDSGGGDGVEFYLVQGDGTEWGWQAKYYEGSVRLNISSRKQGIIKSLKRAIEVHPNLTIWYLCLPMDFTPEEKVWVDTELITHIPSCRQVQIIPWNETFLHEKINLPKFNGLKQAFFNELELSQEWFQKSFENSFSIVKNKFDNLLYTTNEDFEHWYVHPVLCDGKFITERIGYYPRKLEELQKKAVDETKKLKYSNHKWRPFFNEYLKRYSEFTAAAELLMPSIRSRIDKITPNHIFLLSEDDFDNELQFLKSIKPTLDEFRKEWVKENTKNETEEDKKENIDELKRIWPIERVAGEFIEELRYYADHSCIPVRWRAAHYLGDGGAGKTNFCIALSKKYLDGGLPVIYLPAIKFTSSIPLNDQILSLLDIKSGYTFTDFLEVLDALGKIYDKRIPIILDGLNEAISTEGILNKRLALDLPMIGHEISLRQNLVLLTTCRSSYKKAIWGDTNADDKRFHRLYGFTDSEDKKRLIKKYFDHYKIQADFSFLSLERFTNPLYLKIYCETVNPRRENLIQVTLGYDSLYTIFDRFIVLCDQSVFERLSANGSISPSPANKRIASLVLKQIAKLLWDNPQRAISIDELLEIADGATQVDYKNSKTKALLDEELLLIRNWQDGEEHVYLTYDLMAGYFIASYLLEMIADFADFFRNDHVNILIGDDYEKLHPNHEDIVNGLCSLLPIKKGIFVHDVIGRPGEDFNDVEQQLFEKSLAATILLSPEFIPKQQVEFFDGLASMSSNINHLFGLCEEVLFITDHPFNFSFWSAKLINLTMTERDCTWTEYLRNLNEGFLTDIIDEFEVLQQKQSLTKEQLGKINLVADFLVWTFSSTNLNLKKKSANALYLFSIKFPSIFLAKYYYSAEINDPTIFEWMGNVLYNTIIYVLKTSKDEHKSELIKLVTFINTQVLDVDGQYATGHLIIRNDSYNILSLLVKKVLDTSTDVNLRAVKERFKNLGIIKWKTSKDLNEKQYRDGNSLIDYHFNKGKMPYVMVGRGNEYNRTPEYKRTQAKLRWRAYQLGYQFDRFSEVDKKIANQRHWGGDNNATERYADKYIEIAYLEYCGFLDARQKLKDYEDYGYLRTFKLNHDPTEGGNSDEPMLPAERFILKDYIDSDVSLDIWGADESVPDVADLMIRDSFGEKKGKWILLRGLVHQNKKSAERQIFFYIETVFIKKKNLAAAHKAFTKKTELGRGGDSIPSTNHIHLSEIPDADMIPCNEFTKWHYSLNSKMVDREYSRITLSKEGRLLNEEESDEVWNSVLKQLNYLASSRTSNSKISLPMIRFVSPDEEKKEDYEEVFRRLGIELGETKFVQREEQMIDKTIDVFIPVRNLNKQTYLCKNMIDELRLSSPADSTDLFDGNDTLSSFSYRYEVDHADEESFVYLRQDLLDKYLNDNDLSMFSVIWGERDYYPPDDDWMNDSVADNRKWACFYQAIEYQQGSITNTTAD